MSFLNPRKHISDPIIIIKSFDILVIFKSSLHIFKTEIQITSSELFDSGQHIFKSFFSPKSHDMIELLHVKETDKSHETMGLSHDVIGFIQHPRKEIL